MTHPDEVWWISLIKALLVINLVMGAFAYTTWLERKVLGRMQPELTKLPGLELSVMQSLALQEIAHGAPLTVAALQARICRAQASTSQLVSQLLEITLAS